MAEMRIVYMPVDEMRPADKNPKAHDIFTLKEGIRRRGFNDPPTINERTGRLVEGHGRVEALLEMHAASEAPPQRVVVLPDGRWALPVVRGVSFETDEEAEAYLLEHNQLSMITGWNDEPLARLLVELREQDQIVLGWSDDQIAKLAAELDIEFTPAGGESQGEQALWPLADRVLRARAHRAARAQDAGQSHRQDRAQDDGAEVARHSARRVVR